MPKFHLLTNEKLISALDVSEAKFGMYVGKTTGMPIIIEAAHAVIFALLDRYWHCPLTDEMSDEEINEIVDYVVDQVSGRELAIMYVRAMETILDDNGFSEEFVVEQCEALLFILVLVLGQGMKFKFDEEGGFATISH